MSDWRNSAACAGYDPALWFPGNSQLMRREAIHICHTCPVMMQCRKYAETNIDTPVVETTGFLRTGLACTRALGPSAAASHIWQAIPDCRSDDGFVTIPHRGRTDANGTWARRKTEWLSQLKGFVKDPKKRLNAQIDMKRGSMPAKSVNPEGIRVIGYADDVVPEAYLDTDFDLVTPESFRERLLGYALYCYLNDTGELNEAQ